ncbi:hypothetical protein OROGR_003885 [Orobanche gracilis]
MQAHVATGLSRLAGYPSSILIESEFLEFLGCTATDI